MTRNFNKAWIAIAFQFVAELFALVNIFMLKILPVKFLIPVVAIFLLAIFITVRLTMGESRGARRIIAIALAILIGLGSILMGMILLKVNQTLTGVSHNKEERVGARVGVYVLKEDSAKKLKDVRGSKFGIVKDVDRDKTDVALEDIKKRIGDKLDLSEYESVTNLAKSLMSKEVRVIVINDAYLDALDGIDEYKGFADKIKKIHEVAIKKNYKKKVKTAAIIEKPFIIYISGSDTRNAILDNSRSDVNILMAVNPLNKQILLLNTPRDYFVPNSAGGGKLDKLSHCGIYGIDCSMSSLETLYQTNVDNYVQINFRGTEQLIDSLGGVIVESPVAFTRGNTSFIAGSNMVNGKEALVFARERYKLAGGDNDRGRNQMRLITAIINKLTNSGPKLLTNYADILNGLQGTFATDLTQEEISGLIKYELDGMYKWDVKSYSVTGTGGMSSDTYSVPGMSLYVTYPDEASVEKAKELINRILTNKYIADADIQ